MLTFFARPASTAIDVSNDEHGTLATRGSYADAVRRNGPRTSSSRSSSSSSSYNDADKDMPRFARDRATTEVPVTRPTSTMRATYADAVRRNVQRAAHDVLQRVPGMRVLYSSAASVNAAGNGNVNDDDDDGRGGERTRHQAAGRLDRSPLIDRHRVTVPLVGAHHP